MQGRGRQGGLHDHHEGRRFPRHIFESFLLQGYSSVPPLASLGSSGVSTHALVGFTRLLFSKHEPIGAGDGRGKVKRPTSFDAGQA